MRRTLLLVSVLLLVAGSAAHARTAAHAQPVPAGAATFLVTGHGWGHGVGLCQVGAFGMAQSGSTYEGILRHYYTGINLDKAY